MKKEKRRPKVARKAIARRAGIVGDVKPTRKPSAVSHAGRPLTSEAELVARVNMGAGLKRLRQKTGVTGTAFARSVGLEPARWACIESGAASLPAYVVRQVARALGVTVEQVLELARELPPIRKPTPFDPRELWLPEVPQRAVLVRNEKLISDSEVSERGSNEERANTADKPTSHDSVESESESSGG